MAYEFYLKLEGVSGESKQSKHKDEIEVLSWSWGASTDDGFRPDQLRFTHLIDKASPQLLNMACAQKSPGLGTLSVLKVSSKQTYEYLVYKFHQTLIVRLDSDGNPHGAPHESVGITFQGMEMDYKVIKADGTMSSKFHGECQPNF